MAIKMILLLPFCTKSEANTKGSWKAHFKRRAHQKQLSYVIAYNEIIKNNIDIKSSKLFKLTCIRHSSRKLDCDNLAASFKHVIDGISKAFEVNDRDIEMFFGQTTKNKDPYTEIEVELR